jgi:hypothetical protein
MTHETRNPTDAEFALGQQVATPAALAAIHQAGQSAREILARHAAGDWGDLDQEDRRRNDEALIDGSRLFSAYTLGTGKRVWVITEATGDDGRRAATTILTPEEY